MARYTGTLTDCGLASLAAREPTLTFTLSSPATIASTAHLVTTEPIRIRPALNGTFSVELASNDHLVGVGQSTTTYKVTAEWLDTSGQMASVDVFEFFARAEGGPLVDMVSPALSQPAHVIALDTQPNPWPVGWVWVNDETGDAWRRTE